MVSRGRGSFSGQEGFAKNWNSDVKMIETHVRDQLLAEDNEDDGSADSSMSGSESSPSTHAGTRLGSVGNSPPDMKW